MNHDGFKAYGNKIAMVYGKVNAESAELSRLAFMSFADTLDLKPGLKIAVEEAAKMQLYMIKKLYQKRKKWLC